MNSGIGAMRALQPRQRDDRPRLRAGSRRTSRAAPCPARRTWAHRGTSLRLHGARFAENEEQQPVGRRSTSQHGFDAGARAPCRACSSAAGTRMFGNGPRRHVARRSFQRLHGRRATRSSGPIARRSIPLAPRASFVERRLRRRSEKLVEWLAENSSACPRASTGTTMWMQTHRQAARSDPRRRAVRELPSTRRPTSLVQHVPAGGHAASPSIGGEHAAARGR